MDIIKKTSTTNTTAAKGRKILYIVEHYTAGTNSRKGAARNTASWFSQSRAQASADFIVDDAEIVQYNPDPENRYCWSVGGSHYGNKGGRLYGVAKNSNSISIEICSTNKTGRVTNVNDSNWYFTDAVLEKAAELTRYLMKKYGIDADHVIRHYDVNGKPCPGIIGWNAETGDESRWKAFQARVRGGAAPDSTPVTTPEKSDVPFLVRVKISDLRIRKGAGTDTAWTGRYTGKGTFTIVEVRSGKGSKAGWGLLKSYRSGRNGWISLDYATRI